MATNSLDHDENCHKSTKLRLVGNNEVTNYNGFIAAVARKICDVCENRARHTPDYYGEEHQLR